MDIFFFVFIYLVYFYIPTTVSPPSSLSIPPPIDFPLSVSLQKRSPHGYQLAMGYQVTVRLIASFPTKAGQDNLVGGKGLKEGNRIRDSA